MNGIRKLLKNLAHSFFFLKRKGLLEKLPDEVYIKLMYKAYMGKSLNLKNPVSLNEKLQWLKLYHHDPTYTQMVDKYDAKNYVEKIIGAGYTIPTFGLWESFEEIDFDELPNQFVLKCTHDSGGLAICRDKKTFDIDEAKKKIERSLATNFYNYGREWPYKNVKPRIIAEKYMEQDSNTGLIDYKFYCFDGEPKFLYISIGLENHRTAEMSFYDMNLHKLPFYRADYKQLNREMLKPAEFDEMIEIAKKLSKDIPFVRVDLYDVDGKVLFSELTFIPNSGYMPFEPEEWDAKLGDYLILPKN